jgi:hypothetical protein
VSKKYLKNGEDKFRANKIVVAEGRAPNRSVSSAEQPLQKWRRGLLPQAATASKRRRFIRAALPEQLFFCRRVLRG